MLHHVSIGVADVERAAQFYDAVLSQLGYKRVMEIMPYGIAYGLKFPQFWVQMPHDHNAASVGNGAHIAFNANSKTAVNAFHAAALSAGGRDDGAPGYRPQYTPEYYGAFVRDLDGHKIEAVFFDMSRSPTAQSPKANARKAKPAKKAAVRKSAARKSTKPKPKTRARKSARRR